MTQTRSLHEKLVQSGSIGEQPSGQAFWPWSTTRRGYSDEVNQTSPDTEEAIGSTAARRRKKVLSTSERLARLEAFSVG